MTGVFIRTQRVSQQNASTLRFRLATYQFLQTRRSGRDCRNPVAMDGCLGHFPVLDTGNPCRYDGPLGFLAQTDRW